MKMKFFALAIILAIGTKSGFSARDRASDNTSLQSAYEVALHLNDREGSHFDGEQVFVAALKKFTSAMDVLAKQPLPPEGDTTPQAEVVRIAHDRANHLDIYDDFEKKYVHWWPNRTRAGSALGAPVRPEDATEHYRFVWEYITLRPPLNQDAGDYYRRAMSALAAIHNDHTISLMLLDFSHFCDYVNKPTGSAYTDALVIGCLGSYQSKMGLEAIVNCAQAAAKAQKRMAPIRGYHWDALSAAREVLKKGTWPDFIADYKRDPANRAYQPVIDSLIDGTIKP